MNYKAKGEKGELIAIGELAKYNLQILKPLSDNLPFDFVVYHNNKMYRCQVKSSSSETNKNSVSFNLRTSNWHAKTEKKYTEKDIDVMVLCDYDSIFLLGPEDFSDRSSFTIRYQESANKQAANCNFATDYQVSDSRINHIFS